jgi:hypothetical protein
VFAAAVCVQVVCWAFGPAEKVSVVAGKLNQSKTWGKARERAIISHQRHQVALLVWALH